MPRGLSLRAKLLLLACAPVLVSFGLAGWNGYSMGMETKELLVQRLGEVARPAVESRFDLMVRGQTGLALATLAVAVAGGILVAFRLRREVSALERAAARLAAGDLRTPVEQGGDLGPLARSLDALREELAASRAEEVRLREAVGRRQRLAALGEVSAVLAHEVRHPLGAMFNALECLFRVTPKGGQQEALLSMAREEAQRLEALATDLLDFARPLRLELKPERVDVLIRSLLDSAEAHAGPTTPVHFEALVDNDLPALPLDRRLIHQALVNVAMNAAQAMPQGGTVSVRGTRQLHEGREHVRIDVADDGPGIPPEVRGRIFEPFFSTKAQGSGLGLAVAKRIVEEHRGKIQVSERNPKGTQVTLWFPVEAAPAPRPAVVH